MTKYVYYRKQGMLLTTLRMNIDFRKACSASATTRILAVTSIETATMQCGKAQRAQSSAK